MGESTIGVCSLLIQLYWISEFLRPGQAGFNAAFKCLWPACTYEHRSNKADFITMWCLVLQMYGTTLHLLYWQGIKSNLNLPANTDNTLMSKPELYQFTQQINPPFGFLQQHLKAAPVFVSAYLLRLQCQSTGFLKTQEHIISGGFSCGPCGFNSVTILSSHSFLHFLSHILPMTTNEEIVALNLTCLLVFFH